MKVLSNVENTALTTIANLNSPLVFKDTFHDVLSLQEFENLLNLTPFTNTIRFMPTFDIQHYQWPLPYWHTGTNNWPINNIEELIETGVCYLRDCSRATEKMNLISSVLEKNTNKPVDAHIYFSTDKFVNNGFGVHKDSAHNFIIQIQGNTHWKVGSKIYTDQERNISNFLDDDIILVDTVLEPGDAIFVPAHVYHSTNSLSKRISISFPMPDEAPELFELRKWINWNA